MRRHPGRRQLAIFAAAYLTYFGVRAFTEGRVDRALDNAASLVDLEHWLGIAWEGTIQGIVAGSDLLQDVVNAIYIYGHWPVIIGAGVLLFRYRREHYYTLRNVCLLTGALGLFVFALFPVAPPRLTDLPLLDTVTEGASGYRQILPPALVNQYAAMPSFHAGWNLAVGIVVFRATRHWLLRTFAVLMPAAMAFAVIATANHFVVDVVVGVALVTIAFALERASDRPLIPAGRWFSTRGVWAAADVHAPPRRDAPEHGTDRHRHWRAQDLRHGRRAGRSPARRRPDAGARRDGRRHGSQRLRQDDAAQLPLRARRDQRR